MPLAPAQIALATALVAAVGFALAVGDRRRWRSLLESRFVYGVPWGTLATVSLVVAFYLLVQGGFRHWSEPLTYPFITWSYLYPTGWLTAGIAHGSPEHLVSNVAGTLAFAPVAEYAWSHYAPDGGDRDADSLLDRPWIRAIVVFPAALLGAAYATAFFSLGPGLGFSGAVFAIAGFALVTYPLATVVGVVAASGIQLIYQALTQPIVREAIERGPPAPPEWAGIGFQAHLLGFLLGVLVGIALLRRRNRRPSAGRVFAATLLFGFAQSLWLLVGTVGDDTFVLYRAPGVVLVFLLAAVLSVAVAGSSRPLPSPVSLSTRTRRLLAVGWLAALSLALFAGIALVVSEGAPLALSVGALVLGIGLVALPALVALAPDRWLSSPTPRRQAALIVLLAATVLVAAPSLPLGLTVVDGDAVDGSNELEIEEYALTYEQNATVEQGSPIDFGEETIESRQDGLLLISDERELATVAVRDDVLAYAGEETVHVGGLGWRESVDVERTGWEVVGNETAYAVDLETEDETIRTFVTDPVQAEATIDGYEVSIAPAEEGFSLRVLENGTETDETTIPDANESTTVGELRVSTERVDDRERVAVGTDDTEVTIAERETYADGADPGDDFVEE